MVVKRKPRKITARKDESRKFYERRRAGIDRKVRALITGESVDYGLEMNVTVIYEYKNEVSFFRSHRDRKNARWFSSLQELETASMKGTNTNMGTVDQATIELIRWQEAQKPQTTEDIMDSIHPSMLGENEDGEDPSQNETDNEANSDEESINDDTDTSDDDEEYVVSQRAKPSKRQHLPPIDPNCLSPKRKRGDDGISSTVQYQNPAIMYPSNFLYPMGNGQLQVPGQPLPIPGPAAGLGNYSLQNIGQSMSMLPQNQNSIGTGTPDPFGAYDMPSMPQNYNSPGFQAEPLQDMLPLRARRMPEVPQAKTIKTLKGRVSSRRRKSHNQQIV